MLPASTSYIEQEARRIGATPVVRATFFPKIWPNGVNGDGTFAHCAFVSPDRVQADYEGFTGGEWISEVLEIALQIPYSPVVITYTNNYPGYDFAFYYRAAETAALLAAAAWTPISSGETFQIYPFYQFRMTLEGYRAWAVDIGNLLINPGFELPNDAFDWWPIADGCTINYQSTERVIEGVYSAKVEVPAGESAYNGIGQYNGELALGNKARLRVQVYWESGCAPMLCGINFQDGGMINYDQQSVPHTQMGEWQALVLDYVHAGEDTTFLFTILGSVIGEASVFYVDKTVLSDEDDFTAYAEDTPNEDEFQGYAAPVNVPGDVLTYIEALVLLGEYTIVRDIETAGTVSMEAPKDFSDLVAGSHSGLTLSNRQEIVMSAVVDGDLAYTRIPAPKYSPNKSAFFLADQDWHDNLMLRIDLGWSTGEWFKSGFMQTPWMQAGFTDFVTLFLGKVKKWGPVQRSLGQPTTVEVYAEDFIADCLKKLICLPAADGTPQPQTFGEFLVQAEPISGWSPDPPQRVAYFEQGNYTELDNVVEAGGGEVSIITPGLTGINAFQAKTTGANQSAYGVMSLSSPGEMFFTGSIRFVDAPLSPVAYNVKIMQIIDAYETAQVTVTVDNTGSIFAMTTQGKWNILGFIGTPIPFAFWANPAEGKFKLWLGGDAVLDHHADPFETPPLQIRFGASTGATAENWTIVFDDLELRPKYYQNAFQVTGGPFKSIGPVYVDDVFQPDTLVVDAYTQTVTRYPQYGMVHFTSTDPSFNLSGTVMVRVVEKAGGRHALDVISTLLAAAGLTDYINAPALAAAYIACPDDIINVRFEGGAREKSKFALRDPKSVGISIADCLKDICSRMLYWFFIDAGSIKIVPYTGIPPADPVLYLTASNKWENSQVIDLIQINAFVSAIYGWYGRNPGLFYVKGSQAAGVQGTSLDYSWDSPVAIEILDLIKKKVDLTYKFLSAQESIDPVTTNLLGARLELITDTVSLEDELLSDAPINYMVISKEVGLDLGSRTTTLKLMRILGETEALPLSLIMDGGLPAPEGTIFDFGGVV